MKLKSLKAINNQSYDLNIALVLIIESSKNIYEKKIENCVSSIENILLEKKYINESIQKEIFENNNEIILEKINEVSKKEEYKKITAEQLRGYAYFVYKCILFEYKDFTIANITKIFSIVIMIYTPKEVTEFLENEVIKINLGVI